MPDIRFDDVTMIYPFQKVDGIFDRKQKAKILEMQKSMPYTSNEGVIALQHFHTVIKDGSFTVIIGPSGSGKSTLLRIIAGLEKPVLGKIYFDEVEYNDIKAEYRDVAMVFQNYSLYPNQTVYENIAFPLEVKHLPRDEIKKQVLQITSILKLDKKLDKLPDELSGGEKQRVAIARSLIRKPSVLLFDEPFANLDVLMRNSLRNELKKIHELYKTTFVYVTHDQYDALALADNIIILKDGIKQMDDTAYNVYNFPINRFCAEFISSNRMNFFEDVPISKDNVVALYDTYYSLNSKEKKNLDKEKTVTVGIRGSNIIIAKEGIEAIVEYTELIEADLIVHALLDYKKVIIVERADDKAELKYQRNQKINLQFDSNYFHLFKKDGDRL